MVLFPFKNHAVLKKFCTWFRFLLNGTENSSLMDYQNITGPLISELDEPVAKVDINLLAQIESLKSAINNQNLAIIDLSNEVRDLKERVLFQERYNSKACLIFNSFPVDGNHPNLRIYHNTCIGRSQNTSNITYPPKTSMPPNRFTFQ